MTVPAYASMTNTFVPEATGQAIAFVRDINRFKLNQYVQLVNAPKPVVLYAVLDPDQPVRVPNDAYFDWPDGMPAPAGNNNMGNFIWNEVRCFRRAYPYTVGYQTLDSATGWNPRAFFNAQILTQAMTNVTRRFCALMENPANWSGNTAAANTLNNGAGKWNTASSDPASGQFLAIKKSILQAVRNIQLGTNGMITVGDLKLIINPDIAMAMAETDEIHSYLSRQEGSIRVLKGDEPRVMDFYGLPNPLYGVEVVVEDSVIVLDNPNTSGTRAPNTSGSQTTGRTWTKSSTSAALVTRVGGIDGNYGAPSASTLQRYFHKYEMAVESFDRPEDKLYMSRVVDQFLEVLAAPRSGYLITSVL